MLQIHRQELPGDQSHLHGGLQGAHGQQPQVAFCFEAVGCAELDQLRKVKASRVCQRGVQAMWIIKAESGSLDSVSKGSRKGRVQVLLCR